MRSVLILCDGTVSLATPPLHLGRIGRPGTRDVHLPPLCGIVKMARPRRAPAMPPWCNFPEEFGMVRVKGGLLGTRLAGPSKIKYDNSNSPLRLKTDQGGSR